MKRVRSAKVIILDKDNNALVLRRSKSHPDSALHPDIPGGVTEPGESFEIGLAREIVEETGLIVAPDSLELIYTMTHRFFGISVARLLYGVRIGGVKPDVTISWEHDQYSWQPISEVVGMERPYQKGINYANENDLWSEI